ncbi:MAG: PHP domain-containing protein [Candidatus Woesearchaeota archaeon]
MINNNKFNIISIDKARELLKDGYYAIDPHCHSSYSYDVPDVKETCPENVVAVQKNKKLMQVLTDHDNINAYHYLNRKGTRILPAVELTFKPKIARKIISPRAIQTLHINVFGLNDNDLINLSDIARTGDLDELILYLKQNDLDWMYNHPFYHEKREKLNWRVIPDLAKNYFDVLELNGSYSRGLNNIVERLALKLDKGISAGSDSHTGTPGAGFIVAEGKNFKDFWDNVKNKNAFIVRKDMGTWDIVREASLIFNHAFHAKIKPRSGRKYTPATDVAPIDSIMRAVTSGRLKNSPITKKIIYMILQSINYTAGPVLAWKLHVTKNETTAEKIRGKMFVLTNRIKELKKNIRKNKKYPKINSKSNYYGKSLVKQNSH